MARAIGMCGQPGVNQFIINNQIRGLTMQTNPRTSKRYGSDTCLHVFQFGLSERRQNSNPTLRSKALGTICNGFGSSATQATGGLITLLRRV